MDRFTEAYLEAALWSSTDDAGQPLDKSYGVNDIEEPSRKSMEADCAAFQKENEGALQVFYQAGMLAEREALAGHDFWLTRNHHGSGFWDETGVPKSVLKELTEASHNFGDQDLYVSAGVVYVHGAEGPYDPNKLPLTPSDETMLQEMGIRAAQKSRLLKKGEKVAQKATPNPLRGYAITGANPSRRGLQPWDWHALNIALQTMRMNPAMAGVMGGPNEAEARKVIKRITGKDYEQLPESMKRGRAPKSIPASLRPKKAFFSPEDAKKFRDENQGSNVALEQDKPGSEKWEPVDPKKREAAGERPVVGYRKYRCLNCGHEQPIQTNHTGQVIDYCKNCSWKMNWRGDGNYSKDAPPMAFPFGGHMYRPFEYVGPWDFDVDKEKREGETHMSSEKVAMSRKDYILIADVLRKAGETSSGYRPAINYVASLFATALKQENPAFNTEHFLSVIEGKKGLTSRPPRDQEKPHGKGWAEPPMNVSGSKKPRLAGTKLAVDPVLLQQAKELIDADDPIIYDVAADRGQIVGNVKHMSWFAQAVAAWLAEDPSYYEAFQRGENPGEYKFPG